MLTLRLFALSLLSVVLSSHASRSDQQVVNQISPFGVTYQVKGNLAALHGIDCAVLGTDWASCNRATITLTNHGPALTDKNWAIYMSNVHQTLRVDNDQFKMTHIVGDLTRLEPTDKFTGIGAGESVEIPIVNEYWRLFITDVMPRWYVTAGQATPKMIASTDAQNILMQPVSRFDKNSDIAILPAPALRSQISPTPLAGQTSSARCVPQAWRHAGTQRTEYRYTPDDRSAFWTLGIKQSATLEASDAPRFAYRGAFLEVARNFHSKQALFRLLDQMAV